MSITKFVCRHAYYKVCAQQRNSYQKVLTVSGVILVICCFNIHCLVSFPFFLGIFFPLKGCHYHWFIIFSYSFQADQSKKVCIDVKGKLEPWFGLEIPFCNPFWFLFCHWCVCWRCVGIIGIERLSKIE